MGEAINFFRYEKEVRKKGKEIICGVDEAGRGPVAGPVFAAAVILPFGVVIEGLNDSKKVSPKKRDYLYDEIRKKAVAFCIASASEKEIDEINILNATLLAMKRAISGLRIKADIALIDGNKAPNLDIETKTIIKGDSLSASIAAASILAKVERDRLMINLGKDYPEYGFDKHKGYGTKLHKSMLLKYGPCDIHRQTFLRKFLSE